MLPPREQNNNLLLTAAETHPKAIVLTASLDTDSRDASARWAPSGPLMTVVLPRRKLSGFLNALSSEAQLQ